MLSLISQSDRQALRNLAAIARTSPEAVAAALVETSLRAIRAEHRALDGSSLRALADRAASLGRRSKTNEIWKDNT